MDTLFGAVGGTRTLTGLLSFMILDVAVVVELVYTCASGAYGSNPVRVRVPPTAPKRVSIYGYSLWF